MAGDKGEKRFWRMMAYREHALREPNNPEALDHWDRYLQKFGKETEDHIDQHLSQLSAGNRGLSVIYI